MKTYEINQIENKRVLGRVKENFGNNGNGSLALFWGASALELNVKSNEIGLWISSESAGQVIWVAVEINGTQVTRFIAPKEKTWIQISAGMNIEKETHVVVYKDCQPMPDDSKHCLFIHGVTLADNGSFCKLPERKLNIEFIGDSITSGEGLAGTPDQMDWITQWMCASKTYAMQTVKALDANWSVLSQCGWGICWGWDGNIHSNMPEYYTKVCGFLKGTEQIANGSTDEYIFSIKNDFVVLNLGTNDNGAFFQPAWKDENGKEYVLHVDSDSKAAAEDGQKVSDGVYNFLKVIRAKNPSAKIVWTWGMIKLNTVPEWITDGINRYKKDFNDYEVYTLEFDAMEDVEKTDEDKGSRGHPGPKTHRLAAEKLTDFLKTI